MGFLLKNFTFTLQRDGLLWVEPLFLGVGRVEVGPGEAMGLP